ncbi:Fumarate reductase/succinate dehydrogenase flavoprotein [Akanthomyces lecanii RCEF 1005]|uniref:Fumarate reductase/succinate dehydrogenase flavoprotein n=1 Tax=Akanthomyces lecanii RCEF 1005 TaxID=1081108 RepID=A0A168EYR0_CORDF|nr:Fumarate reductase/succinate dehydrogenase flavoprotein [Akanthomyces lecanii RCEF 1005]
MAGTNSMYDLIVVGHGVAGLAAAISAAELAPAAQIAVLERSPEDASGGNTRYSPANMQGDRAYFEKLAD